MNDRRFQAAICEVCGRTRGHMNDEKSIGTCARLAEQGFSNPSSQCFRLGYERQKARAEAAEEGQKQYEEFEAKAVSGWKALILERDALRAELDAIRAEAAGVRPSAPELVNDTMKAAWREGADCSDLRIAQKFVAAINHERTIAAQQRRELVSALRGVEKTSDEREGVGFIERLFRCGQIARAALAAAGEEQ